MPPPVVSPSPEVSAPIWIDPSTSFLASMLIALAVVLVIAFIVESVREQRRINVYSCICSHGRMEHWGVQHDGGCRVCRCRQYIGMPDKDKDWRL